MIRKKKHFHKGINLTYSKAKDCKRRLLIIRKYAQVFPTEAKFGEVFNSFILTHPLPSPYRFRASSSRPISRTSPSIATASDLSAYLNSESA